VREFKVGRCCALPKPLAEQVHWDFVGNDSCAFGGRSVIGIKKHLMTEQGFNLFHNFGAAALGHSASVACFTSCPGELARYFLNANQQHGQPRVSFHDFGRSLEPGHDWLRKIHNHNIGLELLDFFNRLSAIADLTTYMPIRPLLQ
jgi:hypothetical protein